MKLIGISKLYEAIFAPLNYAAKSSDAGQGWGSITEFSNLRLVMDRLLKSDKPILTQDDVKDPYIVKLVYLYVALRPWHGLKVSPKFETAFLIIRDSLKLPSSLGTTISGIIKSAAEATSFVRLAEWTRKDAGLFVRQAGQYWRVVLLCALASDIEKLFGNRAQDCSLEQEQVNADLERYLKLEKFIADNNLTNAWQLKPILGVSMISIGVDTGD
ncbi:hypothetical protein V1519DRAFT_170834 [Lipomyces tetrasporus]